MSISQDQSRFSQSFDDVQCVWMTAGVLAYQLCNRSLDCDACPLDIALKKHFYGKSQQVSAPKSTPVEGVDTLREDCKYSDKHCWVKRKDGETFRVGIAPPLARVLLIPKSIVLPSLGQQVMRNQSSVWIVLEQGTFPVASPLDGEVIARNSAIADQPSNVLQHPFEEGWLYEVSCKPGASEQLLNASAAEKKFESDMVELNSLLLNALKPTSRGVGPTLADGGILLQNIADMLGVQKYMKIVKKVFG